MIHSIPFIIYLVIYGVIYIILEEQIKDLPGKTSKDKINEFINILMWFVGAAIYPFSYSDEISPSIKDTLNLFSTFAMLGVFIVIFIIIGFQKIIVSRNPKILEKRDFKKFLSEFDYDYSLKKDIMRKAFHIFIPSFVLAAYFLGVFIVNIFSIDFLTGHDLGIFFIINCGFGGLFLFAAADIIRLSIYSKNKKFSIFHLLPTSIMNILTKRMHKSELKTFIPTVLILLSFIPFLPTEFAIFSSVTLIASISDAIASISGKLFSNKYPGKLIFPSSSYRFYKNKTIPGYIMGFLTTFLIVWAMFSIFPVPGITNSSIMIISIITALAFMIIDLISIPVNDNFLNPIVCGLIMVLLLVLL
ncbi:MAG: hypothetical protein ACTSVI_15310 [Promethearchaeota archaeon]